MSPKPRPPGTRYAVRIGAKWAMEEDPFVNYGGLEDRWTGSLNEARSIKYHWRSREESKPHPIDIRLVAILPRKSRDEAIQEAVREAVVAELTKMRGLLHKAGYGGHFIIEQQLSAWENKR